MRIRKRFHRLPTLPDLSSPPPVPSMGAAAGAVGVGAAGGGREGEAVGAMKRELGGPAGGGDGAGGRLVGEERGLHRRRGDLPAELFYGCTTKPTSSLHLHHLPPETPAAEGEGQGDLPAEEPPFIFKDMSSARTEMRKREEDGDRDGGGVIGAQKICRTNAHGGGAMAAAPESARALSVVDVVVFPDDEEKGIRCNEDEEKGISLKRRIEGRYRAVPEISCGHEEEEEGGGGGEDAMVDVERDVRPRRRRNPRRRGGGGADASITLTDRSYASVNVGGSRGAPISAATGAPGDGTNNVGGGGNRKRRRSPLVLMEGSRCSRVNGRGWRCCQQTLVGYSLCEHHLGKGRLRSVVRCSGPAAKKEEEAPPSPSPPQLFPGAHGYGGGAKEEDHRRLQVEKGIVRRRKIGTVKARSMSSLLRLDDYPAAISSDQEPSPSSPSNFISVINTSRR